MFVEKYDFQDVLITPKAYRGKNRVSSRSDVNLFKNNCNDLFGDTVPIIASNMDGVGTFQMARALSGMGVMSCLVKHYFEDEYLAFFDSIEDKQRILFSVGASEKDLQKLKYVAKYAGVKNVCLDVANAYIPTLPLFIEKIREIIPDGVLMVGNVVCSELFEEFKELGVDIVKVGIGSGSVCTTRIKAGVGVPQLSAIFDCVEEAKRTGIRICSDGGIKYPGDIGKALGAGASMVMIGGLFAGADECEGDWTYNQHGNKVSLRFYGMSSKVAMEKHNSGLAEYRASEGKVTNVPYRGTVKSIVDDMLGGLRSTCTYVGAADLRELSDKVDFIRVSRTHNTMFGDNW